MLDSFHLDAVLGLELAACSPVQPWRRRERGRRTRDETCRSMNGVLDTVVQVVSIEIVHIKSHQTTWRAPVFPQPPNNISKKVIQLLHALTSFQKCGLNLCIFARAQEPDRGPVLSGSAWPGAMGLPALRSGRTDFDGAFDVGPRGESGDRQPAHFKLLSFSPMCVKNKKTIVRGVVTSPLRIFKPPGSCISQVSLSQSKSQHDVIPERRCPNPASR